MGPRWPDCLHVGPDLQGHGPDQEPTSRKRCRPRAAPEGAALGRFDATSGSLQQEAVRRPRLPPGRSSAAVQGLRCSRSPVEPSSPCAGGAGRRGGRLSGAVLLAWQARCTRQQCQDAGLPRRDKGGSRLFAVAGAPSGARPLAAGGLVAPKRSLAWAARCCCRPLALTVGAEAHPVSDRRPVSRGCEKGPSPFVPLAGLGDPEVALAVRRVWGLPGFGSPIRIGSRRPEPTGQATSRLARGVEDWAVSTPVRGASRQASRQAGRHGHAALRRWRRVYVLPRSAPCRARALARQAGLRVGLPRRDLKASGEPGH